MTTLSNHLLTAQFYPHSNPTLGPIKPPVTVIGGAYHAAGYYGGNNGLNTVQYSVTNFIGSIEIQGCLTLNPDEADWFTVHTFEFPARAFTSSTEVSTGIQTLIGKYSFIRAKLTYTSGSVSVVQLNHQ